MMSLTFGLFTQVRGSGPLGPLVIEVLYIDKYCKHSATVLCSENFRNVKFCKI